MNPTIAEGEDVVTAGLAGRFAVTLGHPLRTFAPGDLAPPGLHWCLAPEFCANAELDDDGIAAQGIIPALELPRRLWAGGTVRLLAPLRVGETVQRRSRVIDVIRKAGRSGPLAFAAIQHRFTVAGEIRIEEEQTIAYRAGASVGDAPAAATRTFGATHGTLLRRVTTGPAMLFRFSAMTFNAHRIHYDPAYARTEDLPERLVHGTLTAALLLDAFAPMLADGASVTFRALRPAPCGAVIDLVQTGDAPGAMAYHGDGAVMTMTVAPHVDRRETVRTRTAAIPAASCLGS